MSKDDLNNTTATIAWLPEFDGFMIGSPTDISFRDQPYTFSWYSKDDILMSMWDQRIDVGDGYWRYSKGVGESVYRLLTANRLKEAFEEMGFVGRATVYNPQLTEVKIKYKTPYVSTVAHRTNLLTGSDFTNDHWKRKK